MKKRRKPLGDKNLIGSKVEKLRKEKNMSQKELTINMQLLGVDINYTSLSKLEGQTRLATDKEVYAICQIFNVDVKDLFEE